MDMDVVHATLQFPVAVIEGAVALLMLMRYRYVTTTPRIVPLNTSITLWLGLFMAAIALNKFYWVLWGNAQASDIHSVAEWLRRGHWFATLSNALITISGAMAIAVIGTAFVGRASYAMSTGMAAILLGVGYVVSTWRTWGI